MQVRCACTLAFLSCKSYNGAYQHAASSWCGLGLAHVLVHSPLHPHAPMQVCMQVPLPVSAGRLCVPALALCATVIPQQRVRCVEFLLSLPLPLSQFCVACILSGWPSFSGGLSVNDRAASGVRFVESLSLPPLYLTLSVPPLSDMRLCACLCLR